MSPENSDCEKLRFFPAREENSQFLMFLILMLCIFRPPVFPCSAIFDFPLNPILTKILSAIHAGDTKRGCEEMSYIFSQPLFLFPMIGRETLIYS